MDRLILINKLIAYLVEEMPEYQADAATIKNEILPRRALLRGLMNVRPPMPLNTDFLTWQDQLLSAERVEKGVLDVFSLPPTQDTRLVIWQGDITRLQAGAIVNAANSALLGCFCPGHHCIDNAIHSYAGLQLRDACAQLMHAQGHEEPVGQAKITPGFNLPAQYVLHTVGPQVIGPLCGKYLEQLASCYRSCLKLAARYQLNSVVFCCISTGEFHFPAPEAAAIAVRTVQEELPFCSSIKRVVFNVFKEKDLDLYRALLP